MMHAIVEYKSGSRRIFNGVWRVDSEVSCIVLYHRNATTLIKEKNLKSIKLGTGVYEHEEDNNSSARRGRFGFTGKGFKA